MDEGSPAYACMWYLMYYLKARVVLVKDVFHREWNDIQGAIKSSGLWWVILLTGVTYNLCYGPWEGSAWFQKMRGGAEELFAKQRARDPLFQALYSQLCRDMQEPEEGTQEHQEKVLAMCALHEAFTLHGPRVTLRRWMSWQHAQPFHDRSWHCRLMVVLSIGMQLGTYKTFKDLPCWGGPTAMKGTGGAPEGKEKEAKEAAKGVVKAAQSSGQGSSSSEAWKGGGDQLMQKEDDNLATLRKKCSNSLYLCGTILARDGLQSLTRVLAAFTQPLYSSHSENVAVLRGVEEVKAWYVEAAQGAWLNTLHLCCHRLTDPAILAYVGLDTTFASLPPTLATGDPVVQAQDLLAGRAVALVRALLYA
eukprot:11194248-Lingulodinium_polyedra.AAC.1